MYRLVALGEKQWKTKAATRLRALFTLLITGRVEADSALQLALKHCRSRKELILAARSLGYRIMRIDLQRAWQEEQEQRLSAVQECN